MNTCNEDSNNEENYELSTQECPACDGTGTGVFDAEGNFQEESRDAFCPFCSGTGELE